MEINNAIEAVLASGMSVVSKCKSVRIVPIDSGFYLAKYRNNKYAGEEVVVGTSDDIRKHATERFLQLSDRRCLGSPS